MTEKITIVKGKPYTRRYKHTVSDSLPLHYNCTHLGELLNHEPCSCGATAKVAVHQCPHKKRCAPDNNAGSIKDTSLRNLVTNCKDCPLFSLDFSGKFAGKLSAITSLNPNPARWDRQLLCLESWHKIGLDVIVVNTEEEHNKLDLPVWCVRRSLPVVNSIYNRPTQPISNLLRVGIDGGIPFMLINSDIEIYGDPVVLSTALHFSDCLNIGVRYNHTVGTTRFHSVKEGAGLDAFLLTPKLASLVPLDLPFSIGEPWWDYWLPHHFRSKGVPFHWMDKPFFYHEKHELAWSIDDWHKGKEIMNKHYVNDSEYGSMTYRNNLEKWKRK